MEVEVESMPSLSLAKPASSRRVEDVSLVEVLNRDGLELALRRLDGETSRSLPISPDLVLCPQMD